MRATRMELHFDRMMHCYIDRPASIGAPGRSGAKNEPERRKIRGGGCPAEA